MRAQPRPAPRCAHELCAPCRKHQCASCCPLKLASASAAVEFTGGAQELYLSINRDHENSRLLQEWSFDQPAFTLFLFDWEDQPTYSV